MAIQRSEDLETEINSLTDLLDQYGDNLDLLTNLITSSLDSFGSLFSSLGISADQANVVLQSAGIDIPTIKQKISSLAGLPEDQLIAGLKNILTEIYDRNYTHLILPTQQFTESQIRNTLGLDDDYDFASWISYLSSSDVTSENTVSATGIFNGQALV